MMVDVRTATILQVSGLKIHLDTSRGVVKAVDGVSFKLHEGETLGIVGESGSGKSMTALGILQLIPRPAARIVDGSVKLDGQELLSMSERQMRKVRGRQIGMIMQDPQSSLDPVFSVGYQLMEVFKLDVETAPKVLRHRAIESLRDVQIADPDRRIDSFPHQMSGGMKQRVVGAMAVARGPKVIIADEPTTALDVTIQAQYLRLLRSIKEKTGASMIFITHDFGIIASMCDRVAVMYAGRVVEQGTTRDMFDHPRHPYTRALMESVPSARRTVRKLESIPGQPPLPWDLPQGCRFAPRCSFAMDRCGREYPPSYELSSGTGDPHTASCWLLEGHL